MATLAFVQASVSAKTSFLTISKMLHDIKGYGSVFIYISACFSGLNTLLPRLRPAIVSEATCTLSSPVSLHSSAALSSASLGRYKERSAVLRVSMCAFCVWHRGCTRSCAQACLRVRPRSTVFLYDRVGVLEASDGSQTLAPFYLMLRWQLLTKGIHTCVYNLSYGSKQTRHSGTSFIHSI